MTELKKTIMKRDDLSGDEADDLISECAFEMAKSENPEEVFEGYFGLEPDYIFDVVSASYGL